jgi:hypothetical protein
MHILHLQSGNHIHKETYINPFQVAAIEPSLENPDDSCYVYLNGGARLLCYHSAEEALELLVDAVAGAADLAAQVIRDAPGHSASDGSS